MPLCDLCSSVPFTQLSLPKAFGTIVVEDGVDDWYISSLKPYSDRLQEPIGHPFHQSLKALFESAKYCSLCTLVQHCAQTWVHSLEDVRRDDLDVEEGLEYLDEGPVPLEARLRLTARQGGVLNGFYVWLKANKDVGYWLLAVVGFSVDGSKYYHSESYLSRQSLKSADDYYSGSFLAGLPGT